MTISAATVSDGHILALFTRAHRLHAGQTPMAFAKAHGLAVQSVRQAEAHALPDNGTDLIALLKAINLRNHPVGHRLRDAWLVRQPEAIL